MFHMKHMLHVKNYVNKTNLVFHLKQIMKLKYNLYMPKVFTSKSQQIGELGETIAVIYLEKKGYKILERNFTTRIGEIDIIAFSHETLYFIEVKAVTREKMEKYNWKPEQNFHQQKLHKMLKTVQYYLSRHKRVGESKLLLATVIIDQEKKIGKVSLETIY